MLRSRILAAATAAVLMLGISVGGAGAAFAEAEDTLGVVDETVVTETVVEPVVEPMVEPVVEPVVEPLFAPAKKTEDEVETVGGGGTADSPCNFETGFDGGTKYTPGGGSGDDNPVDVTGTMTFEWGTLSWSEYQLVFTANPGWTVDLCVKGGSSEANSIRLDSGSVTITRVQEISHFMWANPSFTAPVASASIVVEPRDCFNPTTWNFDTDTIVNATWGAPFVENGLIKIVATATGGALFAGGGTTKTFTAPFEAAGGEECVAPSISVVAAFTQLACDPVAGSFTAGLFNPADPNADKLLWTTNAGTVPSATANTVNGPGVVTVTVRVANAHLGDFAVNETSSLGVVSTITVGDIETALITWTFTFVEPEDCEVGAIVVPIVTYDDYCEGAGPNALRVATFTVTDVENVTYSYTVNGGSAIPISFGGQQTATISVSPGDVVVVTASPADGFDLNEGYVPWTHTFSGAAACSETLPTVASALITPADCEGSQVQVTLSDEGGVIWTMNGKVVQGNTTHQMLPGSSVQLTAQLEQGHSWSDPQQQTSWSKDGMSDEDCLSNLAFTGVDSATAWLGAAAVIMMLVGMGAVTRRRSVEV